MSDSCSWHSDSSAAVRSAQIGSPMPRMPPPVAGVLRHEPAPGRDDARRVAPDHLHVDQVHVGGATGERRAQQLELTRADHDEHRLAARETLMDEGRGTVDELIVALIKNGLVMKSRGTHSGAHELVIPTWPRKVAALGQICPQAATAL